MQHAKENIRMKAAELMADHSPGNFNQALMEYGALVCKPSQPLCDHCGLKSICQAFLQNKVTQIPVKAKKSNPQKRFLHYAIITFMKDGEKMVYLRKRLTSDIWKNLYDFPCMECKSASDPVSFVMESGENFRQITSSTTPVIYGPYGHILTHQRLNVWFHLFELDTSLELPYLLIKTKDFYRYPVPRVIDRFLTEQKFI